MSSSSSKRAKNIDNGVDHPYFVALQAHPEFCSRPLNPSPPFLGLVAAACGGSVLSEQLLLNERGYIAPHPESAKVIPASEAVTDGAKGRTQAVDGIKVRGEVKDGDLDELQRTVGKVHMKENGVNGVNKVNGNGTHT